MEFKKHLKALTITLLFASFISYPVPAQAANKNSISVTQNSDDLIIKWGFKKSPKTQTISIVSTDGLFSKPKLTISAKARTYTFKDLTYGSTYKISVLGKNPSTSLTKSYTLVPRSPAPAALAAVWGENGVNISWQIEPAFAKYISKQIIAYTPEGGKTTFLDLASTQRSTVLNRLDANKSYTISVKAVTKAGDGKSSAVTLVAITPKAPIIDVTVLSATSVELSWVYLGTQPTTQQIEILPELPSSNRASNKISLGADIRKTVINDLTPAASYKFSLSGSNAFGKGSTATTILTKIHRTPSSPDRVVAEAGNSSVKLTWMPPVETGGSSLLGYKVEYSTNGVKWSSASSISTSPTPQPSASPSASPAPSVSPAVVNVNVSTTQTSYTVANLVNGVSYQFKVSAVSEAGIGASSNPVTISAGITPGSPGSFQATSGRNQVSLAWLAPTTAGVTVTGYHIEINAGTGWSTIASKHSDRTFVAANLIAGTTYQFRVSALGSGLSGDASAVLTAKPYDLPLAPSAFTITPTDQRLLLTWSAPADQGSAITSYKIEYLTPIADWSTLGTSTTTSFYTPALVIPGVQYKFRIIANNAAGAGASSDIVDGRALTTPSAPVVTLTPGASLLNVSWTTPESSGLAISTYTVQISNSGTTPNWSTINAAASGNSYAISNLTAGNSYQVRVAARSSLGLGAFSLPITAVVYGLPSAPTSLLVSKASIGKLTLTWNAPSANGSTISDYRVSYQVGSGTVTNVLTGSLTTTYTVENLLPGNLYSISVAAVNQAGVGASSNVVTSAVFTTPLAPQSLSAVGANGSVVLTWTPPISVGAADTLSYCVQWSLDQAAWSPCAITETNTSTISNLTNGTPYFFRVTTTRSGVGDSDPILTSATPLGAPGGARNFKGVGINSGVVLTWDAPNNDGGMPITGYTIESYSQTIPRNGTTFTWSASGAATLQYYSIRADNVEVGKVLKGTERYTTTTFDDTKIYTVIPVILTAGLEEDAAALAYNTFIDGRVPLANLGATATGAEITSLTNGTLYTFRVVAKSAFGDSVAIVTEVMAGSPASRAPLTKVNSLTATPADTSVTLDWSAPTGVDPLTINGYRIDYRVGSSAQWSTIENLTTLTEYTIDSLSNGVTYSFRVTGINAGGPGESAFISSTPSGSTPSLITNLTISPRDGTVMLDWDDVAGSVSYEITYEKSDGSQAPTSVSSGNSSFLIVTGLTNGTKYAFSVKAINTGVSPSVPGPSRTVEGAPYARPSVVQSLTATPLPNKIALTWATPANTGGSPTVTYKVEYSRDNVNWQLFESGITQQSVSKTITNSQRTASAAIFTIGTHTFQVGDQVIVSGSSRGLDFSVLKPITAVTGTTISVADNTGTLASASDTGTVSKATLVSNLLAGVKYYVRVAAVNPAGIGTYGSTSASPTE